MDVKFSLGVPKSKSCLWIFFDFAKNIQLQLKPLWPSKGFSFA
jgi:hypothetical protein